MHVQLRFLFMQDLVANGQLKLSRVPSERNPADVLTKYLQASTLHKLLPKLGVMTRAADSKDLLSVISFEGRVSSQPFTSSFFIGMLAESHASAQLVASRAYSRRSLPRSLSLEKRTRRTSSPFYPDKLFLEQLSLDLSLQRSFALSTVLLSRSLTLSFMVRCFLVGCLQFSFSFVSAFFGNKQLSEQEPQLQLSEPYLR